MKFRKIMLAGVFVLSLTAAFAFKSEKLAENAYLEPFYHPTECVEGVTDYTDCVQDGAGVECTCYDSSSGKNVTAYAAVDYVHGGCMYPLYREY